VNVDPSPRRPVEVTVVVVTHNSASVLPGCLGSLPGAMVGVGNWRLAVVDNDSSDDTLDQARRLAPEATVVEMGRNAGYAAAINEAIDRMPPTDHVLVLNPDVRLEPASVRELVVAATRPGVGITVPRLVDEYGTLQLSLRREPSLPRAVAEAVLGGTRASRFRATGEVVGDIRRYAFDQRVDWATGAAMLVTRQCLDAVGPWDQSFFLYSEETDFALRARDAGFLTWYAPGAGGVHLGGESNTSPPLWATLTVNRVKLYRRRHGRVASALFWLAVTLNEAVRAAAGSRTHRAGLRALLRPRSRRTGAVDPRRQEPPGWICFSSVDWWYHNRAHSDIQLMRRVAKDRPVLFVNSIGMRMPLPGRSTQSGRRVLRKARSVVRFLRQPLPDTPGFHVATPLVLPFYGSESTRWINARLVRRQVRWFARRAGIVVRDAVIVITVPTAWEVVRDLERRALVLNRSDLHSAFEETDQELIRRLEQDLVANADVVAYSSHSLMEAEKERARGHVIFLDHGVDLDRFGREPEAEPQELAAIAPPRVGFFGGIDDYVVDLDLLEEVARRLPDASLVIIGDATCSMERFASLPNVHWLGFRAYEQIPAYGAGFDVALMPWLQNAWIEHANPIKLKEYLALGLPVVSTDFPEVRHYADVVAIARDANEFVDLVQAALAGRTVGTPDSRRARVAGATWDNRAKDLLVLGEGVQR
jgi:GT2 family glycosyltransferase/glycosyltransferase involved in cell wall biosynthesis